MSEKLPARQSRSLGSWFGRDPMRSLRDEMDDLLSRFSLDWDGGNLARERKPSLDLAETNDAFEVKLDVPGMKPDEIDIEVTGNMLRVRGEHKEEKEEKGKTYHRTERLVGTFSRSIELPSAVHEEKVAADYKDGVLTIKLPKTDEARTRRIKVKA